MVVYQSNCHKISKCYKNKLLIIAKPVPEAPSLPLSPFSCSYVLVNSVAQFLQFALKSHQFHKPKTEVLAGYLLS